MSRLPAASLALALLLATSQAGADAFREVEFDDPDKQATYRSLLHELRCTVCQNQSLADSNADLATDIRTEVQRLVGEGADRETVIDFMVQRYGDFVLYRPPFRADTLLLWVGPFILAGLGGIAVYRVARGSRLTAPGVTAQDQTRQRALDLLRSDPP